MEYTDIDISEFYNMYERLPINGIEVFAFCLSVLLFVNVLLCILTTGRRMFANPRMFIKFKGVCLVILTGGQMLVAQGLFERSLQGAHNDVVLLSGISLWVIGRYGLTGSGWFRKYSKKK